jgi:hypothetical protein
MNDNIPFPQARIATAAAATPQAPTGDAYQPGAFLCATWGCEQTNQEFFKIVKRSGDWLTLQPFTNISTPIGGPTSMRTAETPATPDLTAKVIRRRLCFESNGSPCGCKFRSYGWMRTWDGQPMYASHYA